MKNVKYCVVMVTIVEITKNVNTHEFPLLQTVVITITVYVFQVPFQRILLSEQDIKIVWKHHHTL
jgi:hypothetical protein